MKHIILTFLAVLLLAPPAAKHAAGATVKRPNVLFIVCDELNSYIEGFGGHLSVPPGHFGAEPYRHGGHEAGR